MSLSPGTTLGPYTVTAKIGEGGMGEVWQARDTKLDRDVALKVLPEAFTADPDRLARFEREAKVLASLNHPNIGSIYGLEEAEGGKFRALVLELVEGPTLADRIKQGPIPVDEALPIAKQIAAALEAAHERGVIHRDLKPANVKVKADGVVKVLDFGLAKAFQPDAADPGLSQSPTISLAAAATQMGMVIGTVAYMSPEQAKGKGVDKRVDVWAFGVVLYEMLTGARPFAGADVSTTLARVIDREPDWDALPRGVSPVLASFLRRCLAKDAKQRVHDVADVRLAMEGAFETTFGERHEAASTAHLQVWQRPVPAVTIVSLVAVVAGLAVWNAQPEPSREVTRVSYRLPDGQTFRTTNLNVLAVSPDGRRFVYNAADGLYLREMDALEPRVLPGTEGPISVPFFSPDGQSVAYFESPLTLKRLALSGGASVVITETAGVTSGTWTPDGAIFFATPDGISRVPANGGTPELIAAADSGESFDAPQLLPDGDTVIFSIGPSARGVAGGRWDEARVVAQSLETGERTVLLDGGSDARYVPTGHLVYALGNGLFAVGFDAETLTVGGGPVSLVEGVFRTTNQRAASANFDVSEGGTLFYVDGGVAFTSPLAWVDRDGSAETIATIPPNIYVTPRLSPDGDRLLVVAEGDAWIYDIASGRESRLTTDGQTGNYAGWTPSGDRVTYTSGRDATGGTVNVWIRPADGSGVPEQLTALDGGVHFDSWAPDGRTFSAHHHPGGARGMANQLMVAFDETSAEPEVWLGRPYPESDAVFSPDGRYVAHRSTQTGESEIYIRPFPGPGGQTPVSVNGGVEPVWGRNGELFYRRGSDYAMMAVEVSTSPSLRVGPPIMLFPGGTNPGGSPRPRYTVTADGQRFLMSASLLASGEDGGTGGPQVHIVLNWTEELKARVPVP